MAPISEPIDVLNKRLVDHFGVSWDGRAAYRIVWSEDQFDKRLTDCTDAGVLLLVPEVRELPKYKQWIHDKYVLENLVAVPEYQQMEAAAKTSYEPLFVYEDKDGFPLPPKWEVTKFVIDNVLAAMGKSNLAKYKENLDKYTPEGREEYLKNLQDELFGNETNTTDALAYKEGVVVPSNFEKSKS